MNSKEKNLLDLKHSLSLTKGALFLSIGIGSSIAIFFGAKQLELSFTNSFIVSTFFLLPFITQSIKHFIICNEIQDSIKSSIRNK